MDIEIKEVRAGRAVGAEEEVPAGPSPQANACSLEKKVTWALMSVLLLVRLAYVFRYRIDSDEPQHLHVVWQWTQGLIPYRDFFDNHTPLFHLLCAPLLRLVGERPEALNLMRLAMVPLYGVVLWAVYRIGCRLFSQRVALWAALFAGAFPNYFFPSIEFRTDNLWAPLWLAAMVVLIEGRATAGRWLVAGLLIGVAFAASMKTSVLAATLVGAALLAATISPLLRRTPGRSVGLAICAMVGIAIIPSVLVAFLYYQGAYQAFLNCIIYHNILPAALTPHRPQFGPLWFSLAVVALWFGARLIFRKAPDEATGTLRAVVFLQTCIFIAVMEFLWPEVTRQNYLPVYPLAALLCTPVLLAAAQWVGARFDKLNIAGPAACFFLIELVWLSIGRPIAFDGTICEIHLLTDVLRLTQPGEFVMTYKGEALFRPRPFFYVLEPFTRIRLNHGLLKDDIAERLIATNTCVTMTLTRRMPKNGEQFIIENYIPVGQLRVAGKVIGTPPAQGPLKFEVKIPTTYTLLAGDSPMEGLLDGSPFTSPRLLAAGLHEVSMAKQGAPITLIWNRAIEKGFRPSPPGYKPEPVGSEFAERTQAKKS